MVPGSKRNHDSMLGQSYGAIARLADIRTFAIAIGSGLSFQSLVPGIQEDTQRIRGTTGAREGAQPEI